MRVIHALTLLAILCTYVQAQDDAKAPSLEEKEKECDSWVLIGDQTKWSKVLRAFLYGGTLIFLFLGVAIISDVFMMAIERITAEKEVIRIDPNTKQEKIVVIETWNETVANLTLLALGSSAPEILLSCFETVTTLGKTPGELGPSTIVGSAAYNLFVIISICVGVVRPVKQIKELGVFILTSISSLFAYFWMVIVLQFWSPDTITVAEALITLLFFPLLVLMAYLQDHGWFLGRTPIAGKLPLRIRMQNKKREAMIKILKDSQEADGEFPSRETIARIQGMERTGGARKSTYRMQNSRVLSAARRVLPSSRSPLLSTDANIMPYGGYQQYASSLAPWDHRMGHGGGLMDQINRNEQQYAPTWIDSTAALEGEFLQGMDPPWAHDPSVVDPYSTYGSELYSGYGYDGYDGYGGHQHVPHGGRVEFTRPHQVGDEEGDVITFLGPEHEAMENEKRVVIPIKRTGSLDGTVSCKYTTQAGSAKPQQHYVEQQEVVAVFQHGQDMAEIVIELKDDSMFSVDDVHFYVLLHNPSQGAQLGTFTRCTVTILDDDRPLGYGVVVSPNGLRFSKSEYTAMENDGQQHIILQRHNSLGDHCACRVVTRDGTAQAGLHYDPIDQMVEFEPHEESKIITMNIHDESSYEKNITFELHMLWPTNCSLEAPSHCTVIILHDQRIRYLLDRILHPTAGMKNEYQDARMSETWAQQFKDALRPVGEDNKAPKAKDYILHVLTFFWKMLFALTPPTSIAGGWATFIVALIFIGILTAVIAEFASLFGCVLGIEDAITAITFVALGTSLPDTFASKKAAQDEEYADAAVGNVTGSNSVNVFLGLGLPWVIASFYYAAQGKHYHVPAGDLTFTVILFLSLAVPTILILLLKRKFTGGELGGKIRIPISVILFLFWVLYLTLSILRYKIDLFK